MITRRVRTLAQGVASYSRLERNSAKLHQVTSTASSPEQRATKHARKCNCTDFARTHGFDSCISLGLWSVAYRFWAGLGLRRFMRVLSRPKVIAANVVAKML